MSTVSTTLRLALLVVPLALGHATAQNAEKPAPKETKKGGLEALLGTGGGKGGNGEKGAGSELRFDADTLEMEFEKRTGTFEGNVRVTDGRMLLLADKMVVQLAEGNELKMIEATGSVVISEIGQQRKAKAGKAVFDVAKDEIVLTDNPTLEDAEWGVRRSEKMVYNRKKGTFKLYKIYGIGLLDDGGRTPRDLFAPTAKDDKDKEEPKP